MKMHFGQLQEKRQCGKATDKAGNQIHIPSWVPPPWVIPLIDKDDKSRRKPAKDERQRIEIQIDERTPEPEDPLQEPEDNDRGVAILEFKA